MAQTLPVPPPGFDELPVEEKVQYVEALWDRIAEKPGELPVPESHLDLAEERLAAYRRDPSRARSAYEVIDRLADSAKKRR